MPFFCFHLCILDPPLTFLAPFLRSCRQTVDGNFSIIDSRVGSLGTLDPMGIVPIIGGFFYPPKMDGENNGIQNPYEKS